MANKQHNTIFLSGSLGHEGIGQEIYRRNSGKELQAAKIIYLRHLIIFLSIYKLKLVSLLDIKRLRIS